MPRKASPLAVMGPQADTLTGERAIPGAQVVHHLFPNVCHTHYPAIAPIVLDTCREFGIPYHVYPSVRPRARAAPGRGAPACLPGVSHLHRLRALLLGAPPLRAPRVCRAWPATSFLHRRHTKIAASAQLTLTQTEQGPQRGHSASMCSSGPALTASGCAAVLGGAARSLPAPEENGRAGGRAVSGDRGLTGQLSGARAPLPSRRTCPVCDPQ